MAGYVLKIVIENTHPPVWRRVLIPERITFEELHRVIQIIFGWSDDHLHEFRIPSEYICIDDREDMWSAYHYMEHETLVEQFLLEYNWVRYTYDFGDEWRHRIIYEKTDESYKERHVSLLKVKGDNFLEDSGGVWEAGDDDWNRTAFDRDKVENQLKELRFPVHDELEEAAMRELPKLDIEEMAEKFLVKLYESFKTRLRNSSRMMKPSQMAVKIDRWKQFLADSSQQDKKETEKDSEYSQMVLPFLREEDLEEPDYILEIVPGEKTCTELLNDLSLKETEDYCKYLQILVSDTWTKQQMADVIAQEFHHHPEYILYILEEREYKALIKLIESPYGRLEIPRENDMLIRAFGIGLADIVIEKKKGKTRAKLSFAKDSQSILKSLNTDIRKRTYRELERFSKKLENIILVYGVIDFDTLYVIFEKIYRDTMSREDLCRYVYWFARFNNLVQTGFSPDGKRYAASVQLDMGAVLEKMHNYAEDLDYVLFSAKELRKMSEAINDRNEWIDILFTTLHYMLRFSQDEAAGALEAIYTDIMEGSSLPAILRKVHAVLPREDSLMAVCELWEVTAGLMQDLELPMLKGRTRNQYAKEKHISPWETGMVDEEEEHDNSKGQHMYEFPAEIQEAMYSACEFAAGQAIDMLWLYKEKEKIQSEEYICLLAKACTITCQYDRTEKLIQVLKRSSARGKDAAKILEEMLEQGMDVMDDWEEEPWDFTDSNPWSVSQTYVRETPKIGRNDPCPCGSGKKYKRCCGKNV